MPEFSIFTQISLVVAAVTVMSILMRLFKQPQIMGYILIGIIVGPSILNLVHAHDAFETFSEIGISLLLFIIGLGLNAGVIKGFGKVSLFTALSLLIIVGFFGHMAALMLGFKGATAVVLGISLFFSSTIIILKMLTDKHEVSRLFGQIAIGVILLDDVVATIALVVVAMAGSGKGVSVANFTGLGLRALALGIALYLIGRYIMPHIGKFLAGSQEMLFIFSIGWGLSIASIFQAAGLSHEVGALFAGVTLAGLPYATEMASKLKPLRDFFIVIFFVTLGTSFTFGSLQASIVPALILSAIAIVGKPLVVMAALGFMRYTKLTSFKAAIHLSQISEFSIILVILAVNLRVIDARATPIITLVALITIGVSTYLMKYDDKLFHTFEKYLSIFERKTIRERRQTQKPYSAVLIGYRKGGHEFLKIFRELKQRYVVVDYDPEIIEHLETQGIRHAYGDCTDEEFLEEINLPRAKLIVSMIESLAVNRELLHYVRQHNSQASFICHAETYEDAAELYHHGASYVTLPHYIGSERIGQFIKNHGISHDDLRTHRERHLSIIGKKALELSQ
ncbi:MAG TPA: cation:proton antiporter [Candidatus Saccharimonadaceae bacterium]|nr:cation:proton antiporter [Candidatus Saccharimonadaceae bacterium]